MPFLSTMLSSRSLNLGHSLWATGWVNLALLSDPSKSAKKTSIKPVQSLTFAPKTPSPHINMKRKIDNAMIVSMNTMVQLAVHADLHYYSRRRAIQLRGLKEWEQIFPTPLSNKAIKLIASSMVSRILIARHAREQCSWLFSCKPSIHTHLTITLSIWTFQYPLPIHIWYLNSFSVFFF